MPNAVTTDYARQNQARAEAGLEAIKPVSKMVFGDGGVDANGDPRTPYTTDTALGNKLLSVVIESVTFPIPTTARFTARLSFDQLNGKNISEVGLEDATGKLLARKTFTAIPKNSENEFVVDWDEQF